MKRRCTLHWLWPCPLLRLSPRSRAIPLLRDTSLCMRPCSWRCNTTTRSTSADSKVEEKQYAKGAAKSEYFPTIRNDSNFIHLTDTQLIRDRRR